MKKVINVKLDPHSIEEAINEIEAYKEDLERRVRLLLKRFTDEGAVIAKAKVVAHGIIHDNELTNSINGFIEGDVGFIRVDDEHAVFFEFGTGPVGAKNPHPWHPTYTSDAWVTKADGKPMDALYGWTPLEAEDGNTVFLTVGQPAKPFMYETAQQLREIFPAIVKEVFG